MNHPECTSCQYKAIADGRNGEWCYMFYNEPIYTCMIPERDERRKDRIQKFVLGQETDQEIESYVEFLIHNRKNIK